ncbi:hypothetical protein BDP55DRAFT_631543 [Colletotrichum godetiae]|uniref:Uncharacterized protein n=1 Tax=Colletotrichum godetiae TaxID=1209918 RepID=A0AAJ0ANA0_9PEZI|nr:uncharacterized protein BDP55DRAFT_631543 [Colletotrichum godetiae]KAK1676385.1 hypothetical protein BDP55DRAFT_631543 [Colletotrichum godetiae]
MPSGISFYTNDTSLDPINTIFSSLILLCCTAVPAWAAPGAHNHGADLPVTSVVNFLEGPAATDRTAIIPRNPPETRSTPPHYDIPNPECTYDGAAFAQPLAERYIHGFCSQQGFLYYIFAPFISFGLTHTSDGRPKTPAMGVGYGAGLRIWLLLMFIHESCLGFFRFTLRNTAEEKRDYCKSRFLTILNGCGTDTITAKKGGRLVEGCRVYRMVSATDSPFTDDELSKDRGEVQCKDTDTKDKSFKETCTCWYAGYPGLTDIFERPASKLCKPGDVDLKKLVNN